MVFGEEKILCMELCSVSPVQPAPGVSRSSPLVYRRSQSQGGQTSPHDSFCSNGLQQNEKNAVFFSPEWKGIIKEYLWHDGNHNWMLGSRGSK